MTKAQLPGCLPRSTVLARPSSRANGPRQRVQEGRADGSFEFSMEISPLGGVIDCAEAMALDLNGESLRG